METLADEVRRPIGRCLPVWLGSVAVGVFAVLAVALLAMDEKDSALHPNDVPEGVSPRVIDGEPVFLVRDGDEIRAFLPETRHLPEDTLWWCPTEQVFAGAENGELFGIDGRRLGGPSRGPLREYNVEIVNGTVVLNRVIVETLAQSMGEKPAALNQVDWSKPFNSGPGSFCDAAVSTPPT